jgi:hypothetical protein
MRRSGVRSSSGPPIFQTLRQSPSPLIHEFRHRRWRQPISAMIPSSNWPSAQARKSWESGGIERHLPDTPCCVSRRIKFHNPKVGGSSPPATTMVSKGNCIRPCLGLDEKTPNRHLKHQARSAFEICLCGDFLPSWARWARQVLQVGVGWQAWGVWLGCRAALGICSGRAWPLVRDAKPQW